MKKAQAAITDPRLIRCLVTAAALISRSALPVQAQRIPAPVGTEIFRRIMHDSFYATSLQSESELANEPDKKLLIVLGDTRRLENIPGGLEAFISNGGAALIATDRGTRNCQALEPFKVWVDGRQLRGPRNHAYKGLPECIFVNFTNDREGPVIFKPQADSPGVATNRPSYLHRRIPGLKLQATFPRRCRIENLGPSSFPLPFAVADTVGKGRIIVLADHSVFINAMLWQTDNQNIDFADACLDWLIEKKRTQVLFVEENGDIESQLDIPLKDLPAPPLPPIEVVLQSLNHGLAGMQKEHDLNQIVANAADRLATREAVRVAMIGLTIGLGIVGLSRLSQARFRTEPKLQPLGDLVRQPARETAFEQRLAAIKQQGNYYETGRALARHFFEAVRSRGFKSAGQRLESGTRPIVRANGSVWYSWNRTRRVGRLWRLAYEDKPRPLSRHQLRRLAAEINGLNSDLSSGRLRIELQDRQ